MSISGFEGFYRDGWLENGLQQQCEIIGTGSSVFFGPYRRPSFLADPSALDISRQRLDGAKAVV